MSGDEIVYFELNNWFYGQDYPADEQFKEWVNSHQFSKDEWCKENKLCVLCGNYDMSVNWCITAPKTWVEENCPKLLTDEKYIYTVCSYWRGVHRTLEKEKKYSDFLRPDGIGQFYWKFLDYAPENYGVTWCDEDGTICEAENGLHLFAGEEE